MVSIEVIGTVYTVILSAGLCVCVCVGGDQNNVTLEGMCFGNLIKVFALCIYSGVYVVVYAVVFVPSHIPSKYSHTCKLIHASVHRNAFGDISRTPLCWS